ncbi:2,3-diphosphoglycerate-dependent phosphoglycerate mutase [Flavobacterium sp. 83]|uniref:2,3-bisphosphoglycerate-dependent phosphoglycerate mutase n=1 Tax=Flavobacterium sp. 83 TaxID=1131812 RepID=UPI00055639E3|nr:2,3-bisphosphoglycerate-dependent phosphoglycerate mutase [Flavobacterium sp. 83]
MALLALIRHGESIYNLENRFTGNLDIGLTSQGEKEARLAGTKLKEFSFSYAYTSVLNRAVASLKIILEEMQQNTIPVIKDKALNERMYGSLQGLNKEEVAKKYGENQVEIWRRSYEVRPPDGESLEDTYNRIVPYYKQEIEPKLKSGKNILIVAHGNSLRALLMYLENISRIDITKIDIPTGTPRLYDLDSTLKIKNVKYL